MDRQWGHKKLAVKERKYVEDLLELNQSASDPKRTSIAGAWPDRFFLPRRPLIGDRRRIHADEIFGHLNATCKADIEPYRSREQRNYSAPPAFPPREEPAQDAHMTDYHNALRRDPIQRDPIYDALDAWIHEDPPVKTYGSGLLWSLIVSFLLVAGILLIAYGSSNLRTAQTEIAQPPVARIVTPPTPSPRAVPLSEPRLAPYPTVPQLRSRD